MGRGYDNRLLVETYGEVSRLLCALRLEDEIRNDANCYQGWTSDWNGVQLHFGTGDWIGRK